MTPYITKALIENWELHYDRDPAIRAEFISKRTYVAYMKAEAQGRIKRIGAPSGMHRLTGSDRAA